jgi:hypothetical protein
VHGNLRGRDPLRSRPGRDGPARGGPAAARLQTILTLIRAHALLHQASRRKDTVGRIIADLADYATVRDLLADVVAEGAEVTIKPEIRETVRAVEELLADGREEVNQADIKNALRLHKSVVSRRVAAAVDAGVLRNLEDRKGRPARLMSWESCGGWGGLRSRRFADQTRCFRSIIAQRILGGLHHRYARI